VLDDVTSSPGMPTPVERIVHAIHADTDYLEHARVRPDQRANVGS
jgi:hypothetical protein